MKRTPPGQRALQKKKLFIGACLDSLSLTSICGCKVEDAGYMIYLWQLERMREFEEGVGSVKRAEVGKFMLRAGFPKIHIWREDVCISI